MRKAKSDEFRSRVYTDRPDYADLPSGEKFQSILGIIGTRLKQHPNALTSEEKTQTDIFLLEFPIAVTKMRIEQE